MMNGLATERQRSALYLAMVDALALDHGKVEKNDARAMRERCAVFARRPFDVCAEVFDVAAQLMAMAGGEGFSATISDVCAHMQTSPEAAEMALRCCGCTDRAPGELASGNKILFGPGLRAVA
ncbi:hypothetical protein [Acidimangrovimonas pyrenivorans]|uniref:Uncharacterized protein n=1 Tax=Acidimangrovimonas pyrenivorans TaxID=2030798 RepID=A0ABV7AJ95_9RHOB